MACRLDMMKARCHSRRALGAVLQAVVAALQAHLPAGGAFDAQMLGKRGSDRGRSRGPEADQRPAFSSLEGIDRFLDFFLRVFSLFRRFCRCCNGSAVVSFLT